MTAKALEGSSDRVAGETDPPSPLLPGSRAAPAVRPSAAAMCSSTAEHPWTRMLYKATKTKDNWGKGVCFLRQSGCWEWKGW